MIEDDAGRGEANYEVSSQIAQLGRHNHSLLGHLSSLRIGAVLIGVLWFILAGVISYCIWDDPEARVFPSPDEAVNRYAAELVVSTGQARVYHEVDDVEDLRHMRTWVTVGDSAIPVYPPTAYMLDAALMRVPLVGNHLVPLFPALGIGAFAAAVSILGNRRRWIAILLPALAFPALYWALRPWMNIATFLAFVSLAFLFWSLWVRAGRQILLVPMLAFAALAAATRPDFAHLVFLCALLATLAEARPQRRLLIVGSFVAAGALSLAIMLVLNYATTGNAFTFGYEHVSTFENASASSSQGLLALIFSRLSYLFFPFGSPSLPDMVVQLRKYWLEMGPVVLLTLSFLVSMPLLLSKASRMRKLCYSLLIVIVCIVVSSRLPEGVGCYGAVSEIGQLNHSLPRYWSALYLFAAVPVCLLVMSAKRAWVWVPAAILILAAAVTGGLHLVDPSTPESLSALPRIRASMENYVNQLSTEVPDGSVVYSSTKDKMVWSKWQAALYPRPFDAMKATDSIARAVEAGENVYCIELTQEMKEALSTALIQRGLGLRVTTVEDLYGIKSITGLLESHGCVGGDREEIYSDDGQRLQCEPSDAELACLFEKRPEVIAYYTINGWDTSPSNYRAIFRDWWSMSDEHY